LLSKIESVVINDITYPVTVQGDGPLACLCIGIGTLTQRSLSPAFKKMFTVYAIDLYWDEAKRLPVPHQLSMDNLVEDIFNAIRQLKLPQVVLIGHSCHGILALEVAKMQNPWICGVILIAAPPTWDPKTLQFAKAYFEQHASPERKFNDQARKAHFEQIKQPNETELSLNTYEAASARYWGNFHVTRAYLEQLWEGIVVDQGLCNHFYGDLLNDHHLAEDIDNITVPVILLAGQLDFDSVPLKLWETYPKPPHFTVINCGEVGHWPQIESQQQFDAAVKDWLKIIACTYNV